MADGDFPRIEQQKQYCPDRDCGDLIHLIDGATKITRRKMNYMGAHSASLFRRRIHKFSCPACSYARYFKRSYFGARWIETDRKGRRIDPPHR